MVALLFSAYLIKEPQRLYLNRPALPWVLFPGLVFLFTSWKSAYFDLSLKEALLLLSYFLAAYLCYALTSEEGGRDFLLLALIVSALVVAAIAFHQYLTARPGSIASSALMGTFHYQNGLAGFLLLAIFPLLGFLIHSDRTIKSWFYGVTGAFLVTALLLTRSRGSIISFAFGLSFWMIWEGKVLWRRRLRVAGVAAAILVLFTLASPKGTWFNPSRLASLATAISAQTHDTSFRWRQHIYAWTWDIIRNHPLLGTGPGTFPLVLGRYQKIPYVSGLYAHSHYLQTAAEMGLVGLVLLLSLLGYLFWQGIKGIRSTFTVHGSRFTVSRAGQERGKAIGLFSGLLASALHVGVDFDWSYPAIAFVFFIEGALLLRYGARPSPALNSFGPELEPSRPFKALYLFLCLFLLLAAFARLYSESLLYWGRWDLERGNSKEAKRELEWAVRLNPLRSSARYWLAFSYAKTGEVEKAKLQVQKDLRLNPIDGTAHNGAGKVYWSLGDLRSAEQGLLEAVKLNPYSRLSFYVDLADFYISQGQDGKALDWMERATSIFNPGLVKDPEVRRLMPGDRYALGMLFSRMALLYRDRGRPEEAEKARAIALELSRPETSEIFPQGFREEYASPEATLITFWKAMIKGDREMVRASLAKGQRGEINPDLVPPLPPTVEALEVSRILSLAATEREAIIEYELTLLFKGGLVRQTINKATFAAERDGWRLIY